MRIHGKHYHEFAFPIGKITNSNMKINYECHNTLQYICCHLMYTVEAKFG